jgi:hypothetical protein
MIDIIQAIVSYDDLVRQGQELAQALKDLQIALDKGREVTHGARALGGVHYRTRQSRPQRDAKRDCAQSDGLG